MGSDKKKIDFSPSSGKVEESKCKCNSVKPVELFALEHGTTQLCYLSETWVISLANP